MALPKVWADAVVVALSKVWRDAVVVALSKVWADAADAAKASKVWIEDQIFGAWIRNWNLTNEHRRSC